MTNSSIVDDCQLFQTMYKKCKRYSEKYGMGNVEIYDSAREWFMSAQSILCNSKTNNNPKNK